MQKIFLALGYITMLICSVFAIAVAGILWKAFVLHEIWQMLVIPMFPKFTLLQSQAVILCLVASFLTYKSGSDSDNIKKKTDSERLIELMMLTLLAPAMYWVLAWIVSKVIY